MREMEQHSCADCGVAACCQRGGGNFPAFCVTANMPPEVKASAMAEYEKPEIRQIMSAAAEVEYEGYCQWPRVREVVEFAKRMGYHKLGIATCAGLMKETRTLARILRSHGFEVFGIACKAGVVPKVDVGIDEKCEAVGCNMCNPILQAKRLEEAGTELNIVVGLCVGHDSLFYKYSKATTTTLVTKDRVLGHNPVAALYTADSYCKDRLYGKESEA